MCVRERERENCPIEAGVMSFEERLKVDLSTRLFSIRDNWVEGVGMMDGKRTSNRGDLSHTKDYQQQQQQQQHFHQQNHHRRTLSSSSTLQGNRVNTITNKNITTATKTTMGNSKRSIRSSYFSLESLLVLVMLTASLLILPIILPPLPPPPFMLLLLPIGILVLLMILAFMPSDSRDISSSYV